MPDIDKIEPKIVLDVIITKFKFHCSEAKKAGAQWGYRGSIGGICADDLESLITAYESNLAEWHRQTNFADAHFKSVVKLLAEILPPGHDASPESIDGAIAELKRLREVVGKLPKDALGNPVAPGETVWVPSYLRHRKGKS